MALQAVIGSQFIFQALFVDLQNTPISVNNPRISIFSFSTDGIKQPLVTDQLMSAVFPAEVGRYIYVFVIPITFTDGEALYAEMTGLNPNVPGVVLLTEQQVVVISVNRGLGAGGTRLIAQFVKGG